MSMNEFEFGILGIYCIYLYSTSISNFMVFFKRLILANIVSTLSFYSEDHFDSSVILFHSKGFFYVCINKYVLFMCVYIHIQAHTSGCCFFSFLPPSLIWFGLVWFGFFV